MARVDLNALEAGCACPEPNAVALSIAGSFKTIAIEAGYRLLREESVWRRRCVMAALVPAIRWASLGQLLLTSLAIMGSPGPATVSLTGAGSAYGVRRPLAYLGGLILGSAVILVAVATRITVTLFVLPAMRPVLLVISAAYIAGDADGLAALCEPNFRLEVDAP